MMKRMMFALVAMAVTAVSAFAAEVPASGSQADQKPMMHHTGMKPMSRNPQHLLAMGYHKNLVNFGRALQKVARHDETVPVDFARSAVIEMKRSAAQMEIYHAEALRGMPADLRAEQGDLTKTMDAHMTEMRGHLAKLEQLTKADPIDARAVLNELEPLLQGCAGMQHGQRHAEAGDCAKMHGGGMQRHGKEDGCQQYQEVDCEGTEQCWRCMEMHQGGRHQGMHGAGGPEARHGRHGMGQQHPDREGWQAMMEQRQKMMEEMKAQDAELARLVDQMNRAPQDQKQGVMAEILTRMVQQRAAFYQHLEKMRQQMSETQETEEMDSDDSDSEDEGGPDDSEE